MSKPSQRSLALARHFYRETLKVLDAPDATPEGRAAALYHLFELVLEEAVREERLQFSTAFSRLAYVCYRYRVSKENRRLLHAFRKEGHPAEPTSPERKCALGLPALCTAVEAVFEVPPPEDLRSRLPAENPLPPVEAGVRRFLRELRFVAIELKNEAEELLGFDEDRPEEILRVRFNRADRNEHFTPSIRLLKRVFGFPTLLNLLDVEVDEQGVLHPQAFILEPDFLLDVSAVAECFQGSKAEPLLYLLNKLLPYRVNLPLLRGKIANFFLDEALNEPEASFEEVFARTFRLAPLPYARFRDEEVRQLQQELRLHFRNLQEVIARHLPEAEIEPQSCLLEPAFFSPRYGLQGRLDLFHRRGERAAIVELKSGRPFRANRHGIGASHFIQTLLYDLLVRSVHAGKLDVACYILYSGLESTPLRWAPKVQAQQHEALVLRNQLVALERELAGLFVSPEGWPRCRRWLQRFHPQRFPHLQGFSRRDMEAVHGVLSGLDSLEQKYFCAFLGFIAREQQLARLGAANSEQRNGLAALWLDPPALKAERQDLLSHLEVAEIRVREAEPLLRLRKSPQTETLANFRPGDIAVLYPLDAPAPPVLHSQIFKCTLLEIHPDEVVVCLRSRQFNQRIFEEKTRWNLEPDMMDTGFLAMSRGLFAFAKAPKQRRELLLTLQPPAPPQPLAFQPLPQLTSHQNAVLQKALEARDYFLLWGPPGTGKTNRLLKHLVDYLFRHSSQNILLLAYTNRAVDEICGALEEVLPENSPGYLRIGSRYATAEPYRPRLLSLQLESIRTRKELRALIDGHRLVVGTLASFDNAREEMLALKKFDLVVIDEASQILEPQLVGLLTHFPKAILIGDHRQLPAVVQQAPHLTAIQDDQLKSIGLNDLADSLFERLFRRCRQQGWSQAFDILEEQGRMHRDLMEFPNRQFYDGILKTLPETLPTGLRQSAPLERSLPPDATALEKALASQRLLFLSTPIDLHSPTLKTNAHEARQVLHVLLALRRLFEASQQPLDWSQVGIITPYRAQIALLKTTLAKAGLPADRFTIDTVERYQGGARDVIVLSLCTNALEQIDALVSLSSDGVDRKLNVALTRAREQLVVIGNAELLERNPSYAAFLAFLKEKGALCQTLSLEMNRETARP